MKKTEKKHLVESNRFLRPVFTAVALLCGLLLPQGLALADVTLTLKDGAGADISDSLPLAA